MTLSLCARDKIKLLQKSVRVHQKRVILMQKMQNFSGERAQPPPQTRTPVGRGHPLPTPYPPRRLWRLDLNPSHSEFLPTLLDQGLFLAKINHYSPKTTIFTFGTLWLRLRFLSFSSASFSCCVCVSETIILITRSSAIVERPSDASCCWVFSLVAEGCSN